MTRVKVQIFKYADGFLCERPLASYELVGISYHADIANFVSSGSTPLEGCQRALGMCTVWDLEFNAHAAMVREFGKWHLNTQRGPVTARLLRDAFRKAYSSSDFDAVHVYSADGNEVAVWTNPCASEVEPSHSSPSS